MDFMMQIIQLCPAKNSFFIFSQNVFCALFGYLVQEVVVYK